MSSVAVDESPFWKHVAEFEEAAFSSIYSLQKARKEDLVRINYITGLASIALDFVQIVPFLVHGKLFSSHSYL